MVVSSERPLIRSSYDGTVSASTPALAQSSATRRRTTCWRDGSAMITLRTPYLRTSAKLADRAQHAHVAQHARPASRVVVEQADHAPLPAAHEVAASVAPASPAPITSTGSPSAASGL
jgi:hypothetical protein